MKLVTAIIRPVAFDEVEEVLDAAGVHGMTVTEVRGRGRQKGHTELYRGSEFAVDMHAKAKVEVVVPDDDVDRVVAALVGAARSGDGEVGRVGDGKVWVTKVEQVVRVRTGEQGVDAV
ncbi:P-II family nitrogen regulator [Tomitella fengzijianii]|uniref:P-II family nitrogen regulator n=1 Tax=Tomitella fengzijianii TaxID=2597660 RepID=A0A516X3S3_9ACTN|nr:P-II family nitrogen regulator [Tomitella fengzijianii]QDQ97704.1 P-II family nitrogen regulator [Tomitella fengzijianii]